MPSDPIPVPLPSARDGQEREPKRHGDDCPMLCTAPVAVCLHAHHFCTCAPSSARGEVRELCEFCGHAPHGGGWTTGAKCWTCPACPSVHRPPVAVPDKGGGGEVRAAEVLAVDEAAWVKRPDFPEPWSWSEPIQVLVSDSGKWGTEWEQTLYICEDAIHRLYAAGYRLTPPRREEQDR